MLKLLSDSNAVLNVDDFYIKEQTSGLDELIFNMSIYDENYPHVLEEAVIEYEQPYLVKAIDAGADTAKVKCQLDLDALKATLTVGYSNGSNTLYGTVSGVLPAGWTFLDNSGSTISRTIEGNYTPLEVIQQCVDTYGVVFRFDVKNKIVRAYTLTDFQPIGAFASRELNLTEVNFKGKSTDFYTRLYAYGKDGLSFANINNGLSYVDYNEYSDKVICRYWEDDRYTVAENLLAAAQEAVKAGGTPQRSYECSVYDLAATNPEMYSWQDFSLFSVVKLIDDIKGISLNYQVVERQVYPYYPEKNVVTLSSTAPKIQNTVKNIQVELENPNSNFRQSMQNLINSLAASITGEDGGNLRFTFNTEGQPNGIMIMDTADESTAQKILWFNLSGILYSSNGKNGPFDSVWSFAEGGFIADWIVAGTMLANIIHGGTLTLGGQGNGNGVGRVLDANGNEVIRLDNAGVKILKGLLQIGSLFSVDTAGNVVANSLKSSNAEITGGNINIETESDDYSAIMLKYGAYVLSLSASMMQVYEASNPERRASLYCGSGGSGGALGLGYQTGSEFFIVNHANLWYSGPTAVFEGDLHVYGNKNRVVKTKKYGERALNAYETAAAWFGDIGNGEISDDGKCTIEIDRIFAETVKLDDYVVFLQAEGPGECYIDAKNANSFVVAGSPGLRFAYEIKAKQKGFENVRLEEYKERKA